jgi:hypothetical protein
LKKDLKISFSKDLLSEMYGTRYRTGINRIELVDIEIHRKYCQTSRYGIRYVRYGADGIANQEYSVRSQLQKN